MTDDLQDRWFSRFSDVSFVATLFSNYWNPAGTCQAMRSSDILGTVYSMFAMLYEYPVPPAQPSACPGPVMRSICYLLFPI